MASFGAKYPYFCPVAEEPEGALPLYKGESVRIGWLVKADLTVNLASGKLFADDALAEIVDEFTSGSCSAGSQPGCSGHGGGGCCDVGIRVTGGGRKHKSPHGVR